MEFYQKNPSALASLRGTVYEEKIIDLIKIKAKPNKKEITKEEAEKILKEHQKKEHDHSHDHNHSEKKQTVTKKDKTKPKSKETTVKKQTVTKKDKTKPKSKETKTKKVSKK